MVSVLRLVQPVSWIYTHHEQSEGYQRDQRGSVWKGFSGYSGFKPFRKFQFNGYIKPCRKVKFICDPSFYYSKLTE